VIRAEGTGILPLRVADLRAKADGDPAALADRLAGAFVFLREPGDDLRRLGLVGAVLHVVVREGDVERVLAGVKEAGMYSAVRWVVLGVSLPP